MQKALAASVKPGSAPENPAAHDDLAACDAPIDPDASETWRLAPDVSIRLFRRGTSDAA
jgi:hypothetical protein